jgi:hypothetical protein
VDTADVVLDNFSPATAVSATLENWTVVTLEK